MSMKQGLHQFGEAGGAAVESEMTQLHEREVRRLVPSKELTEAQRREALVYLMFVKWKCCGCVKACHCTDGWKQ